MKKTMLILSLALNSLHAFSQNDDDPTQDVNDAIKGMDLFPGPLGSDEKKSTTDETDRINSGSDSLNYHFNFSSFGKRFGLENTISKKDETRLFGALTSSAVKDGPKYAEACGASCLTFNVKQIHPVVNDPGVFYDVTNNSGRDLTICMYIELTDGTWNGDYGYFFKVRAGATQRVDMYCNANKATGRYVIYYRELGASDKFPSNDEVRSRAKN